MYGTSRKRVIGQLPYSLLDLIISPRKRGYPIDYNGPIYYQGTELTIQRMLKLQKTSIYASTELLPYIF